MTHRRSLLGAAALLPLARAAGAQGAYPSRPVTVINPFAPGGQSDPVGRLVNLQLQRALGQPFVLDNRLGAGSTIGAQYVARAEPDGYTLLLGTTSTYVIAPYVYRPQPYDPLTAFAPVAALSEAPTILVASPRRGIRSLEAMVRLAKEKPGEVTVASAGNGSFPHVFAELFMARAGVRLTHVPYRGGSLAMNDVVAGQVDLFFEVVAAAAPQVQSGRVTALLASGAARSPLLPEVPCAVELGLPELDLTSWVGLAAPAGTPPAIVAALNREANAALRTEEMGGLMARLGIGPVGGTPAAMGERIAREAGLYRKMIESTGITVE
ncbi:tripartite tricarboxylate transporter substrate binding protein [Roseomonas sp. OT10]|uniref:Bug family tripartite tricarboxylate transporter substrate binding protein n=1 Tax=Roseomonas cutis TaxID=2897332 RepID=UPI001E5C622C|nr:tripartite tricarboxylate transporter substrate binding protein [Roseomonas sp. OT10]UFN50110.1 tripartite tricarboxylate transporter substrate binding protein [Roseomonas sp. OT10]